MKHDDTLYTREKKVISEIFLTRLLATKVGVQRSDEYYLLSHTFIFCLENLIKSSEYICPHHYHYLQLISYILRLQNNIVTPIWCVKFNYAALRGWNCFADHPCYVRQAVQSFKDPSSNPKCLLFNRVLFNNTSTTCSWTFWRWTTHCRQLSSICLTSWTQPPDDTI